MPLYAVCEIGSRVKKHGCLTFIIFA